MKLSKEMLKVPLGNLKGHGYHFYKFSIFLNLILSSHLTLRILFLFYAP